MMKSVKNIIKILIISLLFLSINNYVYAIGDVISSAQDFLGEAKTDSFGLKGDVISGAAGDIYNILLGAGIIIIMVIAVFLGVKFIMASAEEKADIKQSMLPFIIGTFVTFAAFGISRIMVNLLSSIE